ncbi:hypothetical protein [Legionella gresilensis]|uniref:hypothetical protein n=1 Tax=Legionella gresilensis TaxID=91823 RepID=UPI00104173A7|nr:hypothetical protein [Legionella gresilensis]
MHITLSHTKEEKLKLSVESQYMISNPGWVVNWVNNAILASSDQVQINGEKIDIYGEKIKHFLEDLVKLGKDSQILTESTSPSDNTSIAISKIEQAEHIYSIIKDLSLENRFDKGQFNSLSNVSSLDTSKNSKARDLFIIAFKCFYYSSCSFFGQTFSEHDLDFSKVAKEARDKEGPYRDTFIRLKWMDTKGLLTPYAPHEVKEILESDSIPAPPPLPPTTPQAG